MDARALISFYLLWKSAWRRKFTWFDIRLARALAMGWASTDAEEWLASLSAPDWQKMIASMKQEAILPEAFVDWCWGVEKSIRARWPRLWGKS